MLKILTKKVSRDCMGQSTNYQQANLSLQRYGHHQNMRRWDTHSLTLQFCFEKVLENLSSIILLSCKGHFGLVIHVVHEPWLF